MGGTSGAGAWRSGHLNPTVEEEAGDEDDQTLVVEESVKEIEITDDEDSGVEDVDKDGCGLKRKRTIRIVIRSRAFL